MNNKECSVPRVYSKDWMMWKIDDVREMIAVPHNDEQAHSCQTLADIDGN
jgi:hypothetical protein